MSTLNEVCNYIPYTDSGFFSAMVDKGLIDAIDLPLSQSVYELDLDLFSRYGNKITSPLVDLMLTDGELLSKTIDQLAEMISGKYLNKWTRYSDLIKLKYNPLENYSMVENGSGDLHDNGTVTNTGSDTYGKSTTTTVTDMQTDRSTDVYAMNSSVSTPADKSNETANGSSTNADSGTDNHENTETSDLHHTNTHELTRSGNIGVTTSQQMAQSEVDLWKWNIFSDMVDDVGKMLTIDVY